MGTFACKCGYVIHDSIYPCDSAGDLIFQSEKESSLEEAHNSVTSFLAAIENGQGENWVRDYFGSDSYAKSSAADVIYNIYSKVLYEKGLCVYKCPMCERLYLQTEIFVNKWDCFEKVK